MTATDFERKVLRSLLATPAAQYALEVADVMGTQKGVVEALRETIQLCFSHGKSEQETFDMAYLGLQKANAMIHNIIAKDNGRTH